MRPWSDIPIKECNQKLVKVPDSIYRLEPHPYVSLGAPYGEFSGPWFVRSEVANKLLEAQNILSKLDSNLKLAIFDAFRPIDVQAFMIDFNIRLECNKRGIDFIEDQNSSVVKSVQNEVYKFWAKPTFNPLTPPPHSTGGAIDLTLSNLDGCLLDMGSDIDQLGDISKPDYYQNIFTNNSKFKLYNSRRILLSNVMTNVGFSQHPSEWWHFSYGDQMWSWKSNRLSAIYGSILDDNSFNIS